MHTAHSPNPLLPIQDTTCRSCCLLCSRENRGITLFSKYLLFLTVKMELLGFAFSAYWILAAVLLLLTYFWYKRKDHENVFKERGIKELPPPKNLLQSIRKYTLLMKIGIGHADLRYVKEYGKVFGKTEFGKPTLMVADPDVLRQILVKDALSHFPDRRTDFNNTFAKEFLDAFNLKSGEEWKRERNMITPAFSSGKLKKMTDLINAVSVTAIRNLEKMADEDEEFETFPFFRSYTMDVIASTLFGIEIDSQNNPKSKFVKSAKDALENSNLAILLFLILFAPKLIPIVMKIPFVRKKLRSEEAMHFFYKVIDSAVKQRESGSLNRNDMIELMINLQTMQESQDPEDEKELATDGEKRKKGLTKDEILANMMMFFFAGFATTSTVLSYFSYVMARYPDIQARLTREVDDALGDEEQVTYEHINGMTYLDQVVCETLRMWPPAQRTDRVCAKDIVLEGGQRLKSGDAVAIPIYAIHHLEEFWPRHTDYEPERFAPDKKKDMNTYTYLPFGVGPRNCIGMRLALMEVKIVIVKMLQHFRFVPGPSMLSDAEIHQHKTGGFSAPQKPLKVRVKRRQKE